MFSLVSSTRDKSLTCRRKRETFPRGRGRDKLPSRTYPNARVEELVRQKSPVSFRLQLVAIRMAQTRQDRPSTAGGTALAGRRFENG
jgi:hypothetical protein